MDSFNLKVIVDVSCHFSIDGESFGELLRGELKKFFLPKGEYYLSFVAKVENSVAESQKVVLDRDRVIVIQLASKLLKNKKYLEGVRLAPVVNEDGLYGYEDKRTNLMIIPCQFEKASEFEYKEDPHTFAEVVINGNKRVINKIGEFIVDYDYEEIRCNLDLDWSGFETQISCFQITTGDSHFIINSDGDVIGRYKKDDYLHFILTWCYSNGVFIYRVKQWQFVDFSGKSFFCADFIGDVISWKRQAYYFIVKRNEKWGLIDINNRDIVPCQFDNYSLTEENSDPELPACFHHPLDSYSEIVFNSNGEKHERVIATMFKWYFGALIQCQKYSKGMKYNPFYTSGYDGEPFLVPYEGYRNERVDFDDAIGHTRIIPIEELSDDYLLTHCLIPVFKKENE